MSDKFIEVAGKIDKKYPIGYKFTVSFTVKEYCAVRYFMDAFFNKKEIFGCAVNRIDTVDLKDVLDSIENKIVEAIAKK